jgi:hypothetical protein
MNPGFRSSKKRFALTIGALLAANSFSAFAQTTAPMSHP